MRSGFDDVPDKAFKRLHPTKSHDDDDNESAMDTDSEDEQEEHIVAPFVPRKEPTTYDEIIVEQPPPDEIFSIIFGPLADSIPKSFKDALKTFSSRPQVLVGSLMC